jgi:2-polyprenyl-3-methyl-5-hydroxy-6-metoxy-1,4-benzoquinol methylase
MINTEHTANDDLYYNQEKPALIPLIADGPHRVLDLGCGAGMLGRALYAKGKAAAVIGVEIYPAAAQEAAKHYQHVHQGDLESLELDYQNYFDYVICGDILEHLKDPYAQVRRISQWLKKGGRVVASLPNIRNWKIIFDLVIHGQWEYADSGILDHTHLRFFTRKTSRKLFEDANLRVEHHQMLIRGPKKELANWLTLGTLQEFLGRQVIIVARK